ncbi:MAG: 50S ribosomal protein L18 [Acidobacteria bacterium]|nr:MAG: 50S ribosomal protein L18 [Acidobacteriota bacterium]REK07123.1 MAG: 50S ribosomal protein L18 [Acidobacteriota bacterium]
MSDTRKKAVLGKQERRRRARFRVRSRVVGTAERPRLAVKKSLKYIYAQIINDRTGETLASASSLELRDREGSGSNKAAAKAVGEKLAERAKEKGVSAVVFDRGGAVYHGKIKELAEAARGGGLEF